MEHTAVMNHTRAAIVAAFVIVLPIPARGQALVRTHDGPASGGIFGLNLAVLADLDCDGVREYAVADPGNGLHAGTVDVFAGAAGGLRFTLQGSGSGSFGFTIDDAGDVDGDGTPDVLVGDPYFDDPNQAYVEEGAVRTYSGADGGLISEYFGDSDECRLGSHLAGLGDVNADRIPDILVGMDVSGPGGVSDVRARALSGSDHSLLYSVDVTEVVSFRMGVDRDGDGIRDFLVANESVLRSCSGASGGTIVEMPGAGGIAVTEIGDLDGDGQPDVLESDSWTDDDNYYSDGGGYGGGGHGGGSNHWTVYVQSLATGTTVRSHEGGEQILFGSSIDALPDLDGDGIDDYIFSGARVAVVVSGRSGEALYSFDGLESYFTPVRAAGDLNGDGLADLLLGDPGVADASGLLRGAVRIHSGNDFWLDADPNVVAEGDVASLTSRGVPAGSLIGVAVVDVSGTPMFQFLTFGSADATEALILEGTVPPGLSGLTATFLSFAIGRGRHVVDSASETITFS
jgi:hypothetical protein